MVFPEKKNGTVGEQTSFSPLLQFLTELVKNCFITWLIRRETNSLWWNFTTTLASCRQWGKMYLNVFDAFVFAWCMRIIKNVYLMCLYMCLNVFFMYLNVFDIFICICFSIWCLCIRCDFMWCICVWMGLYRLELKVDHPSGTSYLIEQLDPPT